MVPLFATPGPVTIIVVGLVILLLFGNRLPGLMRSLGRGVVEFKKGINDPGEPGEGESKKIEESASKGGVNQSEPAAKPRRGRREEVTRYPQRDSHAR